MMQPFWLQGFVRKTVLQQLGATVDPLKVANVSWSSGAYWLDAGDQNHSQELLVYCLGGGISHTMAFNEEVNVQVLCVRVQLVARVA